FQIFIYDTYHLYIVAHSFHPGNQAANTPNNQLNFYSGLAGFIEFVNHFVIRQIVYFDTNTTRFSGFGISNFVVNELVYSLSGIMWGYNQVFEFFYFIVGIKKIKHTADFL